MPASSAGSATSMIRCASLLGQRVRTVPERQRDVADPPILREVVLAAARERADDLLDAGLPLIGLDDVLDDLLVGRVGQLAALDLEDDRVRPVRLLGQVAVEQVRRLGRAGAGQRQVVRGLSADRGDERDHDDDQAGPGADDDPPVAHAEVAEPVEEQAHRLVSLVRTRPPFGFTSGWSVVEHLPLRGGRLGPQPAAAAAGRSTLARWDGSERWSLPPRRSSRGCSRAPVRRAPEPRPRRRPTPRASCTSSPTTRRSTASRRWRRRRSCSSAAAPGSPTTTPSSPSAVPPGPAS